MTTPTITERAEQHYAERLDARSVPEHLHEGLIRYFVSGMRPGGFLLAVLENDLAVAVRVADDLSLSGLRRLCEFLYFDVPGHSCGSPEKVDAWSETFRTGGAA